MIHNNNLQRDRAIRNVGAGERLTNQKKFVTYLWEIYVYIVFFFIRLYKTHLSSTVPIEIRKPVLSSTDLYINAQKDRFLKSFENNNNKFSSNIESVFYSKTDLNELMQNSNNSLEPAWKRRILYEATPRGNIIMFYDSYKQGFSYYSDVNSIPYTLLNAVAMKYVLVYHCRDFFVDELVTPETYPSPLIKVHFAVADKKQPDETDTPNAKKSTMSEVNRNAIQNTHFAKLKNYKNIKDDSTTTATKIDKKEYNNNRFISLGKISNFKFTQSVEKNIDSSVNGFSSKLLNNLTGETQLQKTVLNYKDYKKSLAKATSNKM